MVEPGEVIGSFGHGASDAESEWTGTLGLAR